MPRFTAPVLMSSEQSDYSPVVRLFGVVVAEPDSIRIVVDSGRLIVPGNKMHQAPATMRDLYITAMIALPGASQDTEQGLLRPWRAVAESDSVVLADSLYRGDTTAIPHMAFSIRRQPEFNAQRGWVMFRVSGAAITLPARLVNGPLLPSQIVPGGVRVFVCSERSIAGRSDAARSARMQASYSSAC